MENAEGQLAWRSGSLGQRGLARNMSVLVWVRVRACVCTQLVQVSGCYSTRCGMRLLLTGPKSLQALRSFAARCMSVCQSAAASLQPRTSEIFLFISTYRITIICFRCRVQIIYFIFYYYLIFFSSSAGLKNFLWPLTSDLEAYWSRHEQSRHHFLI